MKGIIFTIVFIAASTAHAEIFKCRDDSGKTSFQQQPCADGHKTEWQRETEQEQRQREAREAAKARTIQQDRRDEVFHNNSDAASDRPHIGAPSPDDWEEIDTPDEVKEITLDYLNAILRDPDSLKDLDWVKTLRGAGETKTLLSYRATNAYGGYVRSEKVILINFDDQVVSFKDFTPLPLWMQ